MTAPQTDNKSQSEYGLGALWSDLDRVSYVGRYGLILQTAREALRIVFATPITTLFSLLSISVALFLLSFFLLVFQNTNTILSRSSADFGLSLYLSDNIRQDSQSALFDALASDESVASVDFWDKERALSKFSEEFKEFESITNGLSEANPLPASFEVLLKPGTTYQRYIAFVEKAGDLPGVIHVSYEHEVVEQLGSLLSFIKRGGALAVLIVLLITGFVIASTIRLALFQRQDELQIMRLVGATSWYIRIPCLLEGVMYGLFGSVLGLFFVWTFLEALRQSMSGVTILADLSQQLQYLNVGRIILVLMVGIGVGIVSSFLAAYKVTNE